MYERFIGMRIKVVHEDGSNVSVVTGELIDFAEEMGTVLVYDERKKREIIINTKHVHKMEQVVGDDGGVDYR